jgi:hypothetical protein
MAVDKWAQMAVRWRSLMIVDFRKPTVYNESECTNIYLDVFELDLFAKEEGLSYFLNTSC